jgi:molecular chaperone HtpG
MLSTEREKYEKLFDAFGLQLKFGIYADYGMHKDVLKDLILFRSSADEKKYITLKEYIASMKDTQSEIYYAAGESVEKIEMLPRVEALKARGYEILYLTDDIDEFAIKMLDEYDGKKFKNATSVKDTADDDNAEREKKENEENKDLLDFIKESVGKNCNARFTFSLVKHPVCLSSEGEMSIEMEKILRRNPEAANMPRASLTLEINASHEIASTLKRLYKEDKERLKKYSVLLYHMASLTSGVSTDNPAQICDLIGEMLV